MNSKKTRFIAVGLTNTGLDFFIFWILVRIGLNPVVANYISTLIALCFSFVLNKNYTFKVSDKTNFRQICIFFAVTLFGLWAIQPLIIDFLLAPTHNLISQRDLAVLGAKFIATVASLVWNYVLYDKVVFKDKGKL